MFQAIVLMQLNVPSGNAQAVVNHILEIPRVEWAYLTYGSDDAMAFVNAISQDSLRDAVFKINTTEGVSRTDTRIVVSQ
jgi:DNA-binding Lrp family transcriptional regulator